MNQQWLGTPSGSQGCPGASQTLGPTSFYGPGHQGQGFVVQYKHHQGCHSSMQNQQSMLGSIPSSPSPPLGFGLGFQQAGYQGTTWPSFPAAQPLPTSMTQQGLQQHQLDATSNPLGPTTCTQPSPTPSPSSFSSFPPQPNQPYQNQQRPCFQNTMPIASSQLAQSPQVAQGHPALQVPQLPQGPLGPQSAPGPPVGQGLQVAQGPQVPQAPQVPQNPQGPTNTPYHSTPPEVQAHRAPQAAQDSAQGDPSQQVAPQAPVVQTQPTKLAPPDLQTLEQRLGATFEKSMESMAASLKLALTPTTLVSSTTMGPSPISTSPKPSTPAPTTAPSATPVKAKPPTPPTDLSQQEPPSRNSLRSPLTREKKSSRRSRSRRRRRSQSKEVHKRRHHDPTRKALPAFGHKGSDHSSSKQRFAPERHTTPAYPKTSNFTPNPGKNKVHPIYRRAHTFHQVHQDGRSTIYKKEHGDREQKGGYTPRSTSPSHPKEPMISLRSRSRTRRTDQQDRPHGSRTGQITLRPKPGRTTLHGWDPPDASASETAPESRQLEIPQVEIEVDWRRPSQERDDENEIEQDDPDDQIIIPTHKPMDEDWGISVRKAFADPSRTRAPCEIPANQVVVPPTTISEKAYNKFAAILGEYNPKAPQTVVGNMTSIFAHSGKMTMKQAEGSYTFEVSSLELFGLFVPTCFETKPPFDGNGSYVYHIVHGTSTKGASTILAEEMIRPGDFDIKRASQMPISFLWLLFSW